MKKYLIILLLGICGTVIVHQSLAFLRQEVGSIVRITLLSQAEFLSKAIGNVHEDADVILNGLSPSELDKGFLLKASLYAPNNEVKATKSYDADRQFANFVPDSNYLNRAWLGFTEVQLINRESDQSLAFGVVILPLTQEGNVTSVLALTYDVASLGKRLALHYDQITLVIFLALALCLLIVILLSIRRDRLKREADHRADFLTNNDPLTGLPHRASFMQALEARLKQKSGDDDVFTLFVINLDKFKDFNTTHGREVADELIKLVSNRLSRVIDRRDQLFRLGGGEFAIISDRGHDRDGGQPSLSNFGETVIGVIYAISRVSGRDVSCSASIAAALAPTDGKTSEALMAATQLAMERARNEGRGTFCFFEATMDMASRERKQLEEDLRTAVIRQEFEAHYQPQFNSLTGELVGFESLIRWRHPERGLVRPDHFIPLAEETKLIVDMGYWILQRACLDALSWSQPVKVAVNLSPVQFEHDNIALVIAKVLDKTGLPPQRLEVEITESMLVDKQQEVSKTLSSLSAMGVRIAMDDFGTGYSSLATLVQFDFHKLKIDRSFIIMMENQKGSEAIVDFVIKLGRALGVDILAEGVETWDQVELLRQLGCSLIQGYYFGKPMTQSDILKQFGNGGFARDLPAFIPRQELAEAYNPLRLRSFSK